MFRSGQVFDKLLDKVTNHCLLEPDWPGIIQICDSIRQQDVKPKYAVAAIKKKLIHTNPHTVLYALLVLESIVKNCGSAVHEEITQRLFCDFMHELFKSTTDENVRQKILELIQTWNHAFRKMPEQRALKELMGEMQREGVKFPQLRESDAMFSADTAPQWADGNVCHRCHVQFNIILRKHHCRACGQIFCNNCTSKVSTLPKYGIEKEVRVCDSCYDEMSKPSAAAKAAAEKQSTELPSDYLKSTLAQQSQDPPRKSEQEIREEEEFELALALSQSEAEAKEKEKMQNTYKQHTTTTSDISYNNEISNDEQNHPELAKYLDRNYWESLHLNDSPSKNSVTGTNNGEIRPTSPSAPTNDSKFKSKENGIPTLNSDQHLEEFMKTLKSQVEVFINRMKSNFSRGRSIANDTSVQSLFMNITAMHSTLLRYIQEHDDSRLHFEQLQDKLTQMKDAREALDALREEHREKLRREAEEAERQRQLQMAYKLQIMRKQKQDYLQYQRELAIQRMQEQEREMKIRQEQQKQQYLMGPQYGNFTGSPVHMQQFAPPPNSAPMPVATYYGYGGMPPGIPVPGPQMRGVQSGGPIGQDRSGHMVFPPPGSAPGQYHQPMMGIQQVPQMGIPPGHFGPPPPQQHQQQPNQQQQQQQPPPQQQQKNGETETAELISFD